ncbi:MAG: hypothetical protein M0024_07880 [Nitrospiraceae bacterium]|nr:hypothetical protein [Nitrospiraceae bacterium]
MSRKNLIILLAAAFVISAFGSAFALPSYVTQFSGQYPTAGAIANCGLCHIDPAGGGPRNPFGNDFATNGHSFTAIQNLDSDGDGFTNLAEITATPPTYPGDPASKPAPATPPPPATCTSFTYSAWGACQADSTQSRTVTSSLPSGCTGGSPLLTQSCTYVPPVNACTSFTYSAWGTCQSNNTQTRTVTSSLPSGCTGGSPLLTQICNYVPPVNACTSFTYSAWGACQSSNTQTRTVTSSLPSGCTGGSPVLSQACTSVPPVTPPPSGAMGLPTSEQTFLYNAVADPVVSADPAQAKPIGVGPLATGGNTIDLKVNIGPFEAPVDISFFIYAPAVDPEELYFMAPNYDMKRLSDTVGDMERSSYSSAVMGKREGNTPSSVKFKRIAFWKTDVTSVNEEIYKGSLAPGYYNLVLVVKTPGNDNNYYSWSTQVVVPGKSGSND